MGIYVALTFFVAILLLTMPKLINHKLNYAPIEWDDNGAPRSTQFDDPYFCAENGMLESQYVFCGGNELKRRWQGLSESQAGTFTIGETGFGSGLNFLCTWLLWQEWAPKSWTLQYVSIDQFPLNKEDLDKILRLWPELNKYADLLVGQYSKLINQNEHISFDQGKIKLSLITKHVVLALDDMRKENYGVDAWYLDGFAPAKNPEMWSDDVFAKMAPLSKAGTTVSTYTSTGFVRRGLIKNRFETVRAPGFGRKRHMLKGKYCL